MLQSAASGGAVHYPYVATGRGQVLQDTGGSLPSDLVGGARIVGGSSGAEGIVGRAAMIGADLKVFANLVSNPIGAPTLFTAAETVAIAGSAQTFVADVVTALDAASVSGIPAGHGHPLLEGNPNYWTTEAIASSAYFDPAIHRAVEVEVFGFAAVASTSIAVADHLGNEPLVFTWNTGGPSVWPAPIVFNKGLQLGVPAAGTAFFGLLYRLSRVINR